MKKSLPFFALILLTLGIMVWSCQREGPAGPDVVPVPHEREAQTGETDTSVPEAELAQLDPLVEVRLITPSDEVIRTHLVWRQQDQIQGLSGIMPRDFDDDMGKLFFYLADGTRSFWMPDTYFDLDLFYLNQELEIIEIVWSLPHHPGRTGDIPRAPAIRSRHVLEMKSGSPIAAGLRVGDRLGWGSRLTLRQTESKIRQQQ
jgi:uncharacterized protein